MALMFDAPITGNCCANHGGQTYSSTHQLVLINLFVYPTTTFISTHLLSTFGAVAHEDTKSLSSEKTDFPDRVYSTCDELDDCGEVAGVHVPSSCSLFLAHF